MKRTVALAAVLLIAACGGSDEGDITDAQYRTWRRQCQEQASEQTTGNAAYINAVNECLLDKEEATR